MNPFNNPFSPGAGAPPPELAGREELAIARFVWGLPQRPKGTDTITVRVERPMRVVGDVGVATEQIFLPAELNGR